ncbi:MULTISPECIES: phenol hydroxylase subunit [Psychrobacter]|uniref:phenol hydroxylase subunit n=1 Tax=Psychrobacter TaxID=497 RepID=UPI000C7C0BBF|nr:MULTISPECIES: phenol hydroxylase subunit [Psychrobacter]PKH80890.1 phenol hydroxylase [Psychrobacter sp. 4Bb]|tara:strand:- start:280 stop:591 length:312 start_codon:yes stop_codon:yes gene_type:complete
MNSPNTSSNYHQESNLSFNDLPKYVRVRSEPDAKFVMFDFAIGDSSLFVELVLPPKSFEDFCINNKVIPMTAEQMVFNDEEEDKWRYGTEATLISNNRSESSH